VKYDSILTIVENSVKKIHTNTQTHTTFQKFEVDQSLIKAPFI